MQLKKQLMLDSKLHVHGVGEMVSAKYAIDVIEELQDALRRIQVIAESDCSAEKVIKEVLVIANKTLGE